MARNPLRPECRDATRVQMKCRDMQGWAEQSCSSVGFRLTTFNKRYDVAIEVAYVKVEAAPCLSHKPLRKLDATPFVFFEEHPHVPDFQRRKNQRLLACGQCRKGRFVHEPQVKARAVA